MAEFSEKWCVRSSLRYVVWSRLGQLLSDLVSVLRSMAIVLLDPLECFLGCQTVRNPRRIETTMDFPDEHNITTGRSFTRWVMAVCDQHGHSMSGWQILFAKINI